MSILADQIHKFRLERGMTQQQLGRLIGVSKVSISGYEKGKRTPSIENLVELSRVFRCTIDYLVGSPYLDDIMNDYSTDEFLLKSIKRSNTVYRFIMDNPRNNLNELENYILQHYK